jgi:hypothetical protein
VLSLLLLSAARRWWKYALLCVILSIAMVHLVATEDHEDYLPPSLRGIETTNYKNVALRPIESRPDAEEWATLTRHEMSKKYLKCNWKKGRQPHDPDTWIGMREAYISVVGKQQATVELDAHRTFETAFQIPFEVRQSPGMGRGIFALKDVPKGGLLYDFSQSAQFRKGLEFAEFLRILKPNLACDVLMWSYTQYFGEGLYSSKAQSKDNLRIVTDLDPGSFCNNGGTSEGNMAWLNDSGEVAEGDIGDGKTDNPPHANIKRKNGSVRNDAVKSSPLVATRDIQKGDELLCMYNQFSEGLELLIK